MMKLYDVVRGTATVKIKGAEPERVLNTLAQKGVEFWDTSPNTDFSIVTTVWASDYPSLCDINGVGGCEISLISATGGKRILKNSGRRMALLLSLCFVCILLAMSSLFIWDIKISGNETLSDGEVLRALSTVGFETGSFRPAVDCEAIKTKLMLNNDKISWVAINISGSRAQVIIHERSDKPEIVAESSPQSIYAAKTGLITKLSVLEGSAAVSVGDSVVQGDLIVDGTMLSETAETRYVHAMAVVEARTWYELTCVIPLYEYAKNDIESESRKISLFIGKNQINFYSDSRNSDTSCDKIIEIMQLGAGSAYVLPLGIESVTETAFTTEYRQIDTDAAVSRMKCRLTDELKALIGDGEILSTSFSVCNGDELLYVTLRAECIENIAISGEI